MLTSALCHSADCSDEAMSKQIEMPVTLLIPHPRMNILKG